MKVLRCLMLIGLLIVPELMVQGASRCADGTPASENLVCDITPPTSGNTDNQFDGDLGNDVMTQAAGVSTVDIDGDGSATSDLRGSGNGGADTITNYGTVTASIAGDWSSGTGGADIIYNYGVVQNNIMGDESSGAGGNDTITNGGVVGSTINGEGGNDTVIIIDASQGGSDHNLLLEGGLGSDTLIFRFSNTTLSSQAGSALVGKSPASGRIVVGSETYTWANFEQLRNEPASGTPVPTSTQPPTATSAPSTTPAPTNTPISTSTPKPPTMTPSPTATVVSGGSTTITVAINSGANDANEVNGVLDLSNTQLWIGNAGSAESYTGLRFASLNIPKGTTITSAQLQVFSLSQQWTQMNLNIGGEVVANSIPFSASSKPSQRLPLTGTRVIHSSNTSWAANTWYSLGDVKPVVQEIVNTSAWTTGNALTLILKGTVSGWGRKFVGSFEGGNATSVRLVITYSS